MSSPVQNLDIDNTTIWYGIYLGLVNYSIILWALKNVDPVIVVATRGFEVIDLAMSVVVFDKGIWNGAPSMTEKKIMKMYVQESQTPQGAELVKDSIQEQDLLGKNHQLGWADWTCGVKDYTIWLILSVVFHPNTIYFNILSLFHTLGTTTKESLISWKMQFLLFVFKEVFEFYTRRFPTIATLLMRKERNEDNHEKMLPLIASFSDSVNLTSVEEFPWSNLETTWEIVISKCKGPRIDEPQSMTCYLSMK